MPWLWRLLLALGLGGALGGCATPTPNGAQTADAGSPASSLAQDGNGRLLRLDVDAPDELKTLLQTHLDLAHAMALPDASRIEGSEWARLIEAVPAQAKQLLQTEGRFAAEVSVRTEADTELRPLGRLTGNSDTLGLTPVPITRVKVTVNPGPLARVRKLSFEVQGALAELAEQGDEDAQAVKGNLIDGWGLPLNSGFNNARWSDAKTAVIAQLRAAGYVGAAWSGTSAQVEADGRSVQVFVVVDSGPLFRAGAIDVEGLVIQDRTQVLALASFKTGEALTESRLIDYQERLQKTGLFDQVGVTIDPDPQRAGAARVNVKLKEASLHTATFAVGVTSNVGPHVSVEHTYRRVFDMALTSRNKLTWAESEQTIDSEISTHRDADLNRNLVGLLVSREIDSDEILLSQRWRLGQAHDSTEHEWFNFVQAERARECDYNSTTLRFDCEDLNAVSLNRYAIWRRVDSVLLPTKGYSTQLQGGAGVSDGNDSKLGPFSRLYGRVIGYWPLGQSWYSQARLEVGQVLRASSLQVPDSQLFRAGGDESVRGYSYRSLAPESDAGTVRGGAVLFTGSLEVARPFTRSLPSVWWAAFVDAGRAGDQWKGLDPALGYGLGVRWRSPVGPLKLDWAWGRDVGHARLHINVGLAF